jgi:hypothetical protein
VLPVNVKYPNDKNSEIIAGGIISLVGRYGGVHTAAGHIGMYK